MPANLSPEYKQAQDAYRRARDPAERLLCLREMLRTIPKHKGTEHLQAELKTRLKELTEELHEHKRAGHGGPSFVVHPEGAAQVALLGPPNSGKSSLHARLTGSHAVIGPYPFATKLPLPGMLACEDVQVQLVDLPPIAHDYVEPWMGNTLETADAALLVIDVSDPDCVEQLQALEARLVEKRVTLRAPGKESAPEDVDPFRSRLPALLLASKADLLEDTAAEIEAFVQLAAAPFPALAVSAQTGLGLGLVAGRLFEALGIVRVYTKPPGHPAEKSRPFTLRGRPTVRDVARLVHRGRAAELRFARLWGSAEFGGQQVSPDHPLLDRDIVELHW